jgi:hypothetical protein
LFTTAIIEFSPELGYSELLYRAAEHSWALMLAGSANTAKAAPIGALSFLVLVVVAACCLGFDLFMRLPQAGSVGRWIAALLFGVGYFLFPAAVAFTIYSILFESSRIPAAAALALAVLIFALTFLSVPFFLDGLLLLPFWFLAAMGIIRFVKWRSSKAHAFK